MSRKPSPLDIGNARDWRTSNDGTEAKMMQAMMNTNAGEWRMTGTGIALLVALVPAAVAVIKNAIVPGRSNGGRREP